MYIYIYIIYIYILYAKGFPDALRIKLVYISRPRGLTPPPKVFHNLNPKHPKASTLSPKPYRV